MTPDALAALHARCFPDAPWDAGAFAALLNQPDVALIGDAGGFVLARFLPPEAEILTFAVAPERRRQGRGAALLRALTGQCAANGVTRVFLEVADDNTAALALYCAQGFAEIGRRRGYYARPGGNRADALSMRAVLT